jgi:hypothetical protein
MPKDWATLALLNVRWLIYHSQNLQITSVALFLADIVEPHVIGHIEQPV